ncbi:MAG: cyanophycin synthetase [Ferruginibacter sp.]
MKRRFEYIIKNDKQVMIDDYAHHPEELRALITGAKTLFSDKKCTVIFSTTFVHKNERSGRRLLQRVWTWQMK